MLKHLLTQTATILTPTITGQDQYGSDVVVYSNTSGRTWKCRVDPYKDQEYEVDRDTRKSWFKLFLTEHADGQLSALCRVTVDGTTYEVFGEPKRYRQRARVNHIEAVLRIIEG